MKSSGTTSRTGASGALSAFIFACALVTSVIAGIAGERVASIPFPLGTLVVLLTFICCWLVLKMRRLSAKVEAIRHNTLAFGTFERSLSDRLGGIDRAGENRDAQLAQITDQLGSQRRDIEEIRATPTPVAHIELPQAALTASAVEDQPVTEHVTTPELKSAIQSDALSLHLEPIVTLPSRSPQHFVLSMRMQDEDGAWLEDKAFSKIAQTGRLWPLIDRKMLFAGIRVQRRLGSLNKRTSLLCPIHAQTLSARRTFEPILQFAKANLSLADSLAFLVDRDEYETLPPPAKSRLGDLVDAGFHLALSGYRALASDPRILAQQGFVFLLTPAKDFSLARTKPENAAIKWSSLGTSFSRAGTPLVITGISHADSLPDLFESDINLASGPLFAPPRPLRDELKDEVERRA